MERFSEIDNKNGFFIFSKYNNSTYNIQKFQRKIKMLIYNLYTDKRPVTFDWNDTHKHIALNIREIESEDGIQYLYDVVERVPAPYDKTSIIKTAVESIYTQEELSYIMTHIFEDSDKVNEYKNLTHKLTKYCDELGY